MSRSHRCLRVLLVLGIESLGDFRFSRPISVRSTTWQFSKLGAWLASLIVATLSTRADTDNVVGDTSLASLNAAVGLGGAYHLAATGTVFVTRTIVVSKNTILANTNHSITISGGDTNGSVQIFQVLPGAQLTLQGLTIANGGGTNNSAIVNSGLLILKSCTFSNNVALGAPGTTGSNGTPGSISGATGRPGTAGTSGSGGAIYNNNHSTCIVSQCTFVFNQAAGGKGGTGGAGGASNFQGGDGGGAGDGGPGHGGAIYSAGQLEIADSLFRSNSARGGEGGLGGASGAAAALGSSGNGGTGAVGAGGAIYTVGSIFLNSSTFLGNSVLGGHSTNAAGSGRSPVGITGRAGASSFGGGLFNSGIGRIVNCTFSTNIASGGNGGIGGTATPYPGNGGAGGNAWGGNCYNDGTIYATNCTFAAGTTRFGTGGAKGSGGVLSIDGLRGSSLGDNVANTGPVFLLKNTLLAYPQSSANAYGMIEDGSNNLSSDNSPASFPADRRNVNPLLVPLADNGGPTLTMALAANSPAIDAGDSSGIMVVDQRGSLRSGVVDVGAFEFQHGLTASFGVGKVSISWAYVATHFTLEAATSLRSETAWVAITNSLQITGGVFKVDLPMTNQVQFFRLH